MRIEVEVFEDKMPSLLGTSEEESTSEPETAVDVEFDGNWQSHAYSNSNVSRTHLNEHWSGTKERGDFVLSRM